MDGSLIRLFLPFLSVYPFCTRLLCLYLFLVPFTPDSHLPQGTLSGFYFGEELSVETQRLICRICLQTKFLYWFKILAGILRNLCRNSWSNNSRNSDINPWKAFGKILRVLILEGFLRAVSVQRSVWNYP